MKTEYNLQPMDQILNILQPFFLETIYNSKSLLSLVQGSKGKANYGVTRLTQSQVVNKHRGRNTRNQRQSILKFCSRTHSTRWWLSICSVKQISSSQQKL